MHTTLNVDKAIEGRIVGITTSAMASGAAKLTVLHREAVDTLPRLERPEIRVLHARLEPGDRTPRHSHRHPVTVYMLEGTFTLELDGREPVHVRAGEVFVEPAHVAMTGRNLDAQTPATMALFYVCDPEAPFADPVA
jgi:quercetin dioxygenase-like cupin family protein